LSVLFILTIANWRHSSAGPCDHRPADIDLLI